MFNKSAFVGEKNFERYQYSWDNNKNYTQKFCLINFMCAKIPLYIHLPEDDQY